MFTAYLWDTAAARNMAPFHSNGATIGGQPTLTTRPSVKDVSNTLGPTEAHTTTDMPTFQRAQRATNLIHQQTCLTPSTIWEEPTENGGNGKALSRKKHENLEGNRTKYLSITIKTGQSVFQSVLQSEAAGNSTELFRQSLIKILTP